MLNAIKFPRSLSVHCTPEKNFKKSEQAVLQPSDTACKKFPCEKKAMSAAEIILEEMLFQIEEVARQSCGEYFEFFKPYLLWELFEFRNQLTHDEAALFTVLARKHGYDMSDTRLLRVAFEEGQAFNRVLAREN